MTKKLQGINLGVLLVVNIFIIIAFMSYNPSACGDGLSGGECVKHKDNFLFLIQIMANVGFSAFYLIAVNKKKWLMLTLSLVLTTFFYIIAATLHSFNESGGY